MASSKLLQIVVGKNINSSKGTTGNFILINGTPIAWWSNKQTITAQSSCEAEYTALSALAVIAKWIQPLYNEIFCVKKEEILTETENTSALIRANSNKITARNRHFLKREETIRESINEALSLLNTLQMRNAKQIGLTKALQRLDHTAFCNMINIDLKHSGSGGYHVNPIRHMTLICI
ncbi:hypothetical protein K3495_g2507 [Podosphaera aphanis]|nr:hypothetical protein K3495_g2507 [Podosphaera aphanis]